MITARDNEYKATKRIKQGKDILAVPFDELARWIASVWRVSVLNVIYDHATSLHSPRLQVILEYRSHAEAFRDGANFDQEKRKAIATKFLEIIESDDSHRFDVDGLFVVFSAFAPLANEEADSQITEMDIARLKAKIGNPDLWEISRCFGHVTFFFFSDAQARRYEALGKRAEYAKMYLDILKPHDEFGYLSAENFSVDFDSKENLDKNYHGNWFYYYK